MPFLVPYTDASISHFQTSLFHWDLLALFATLNESPPVLQQFREWKSGLTSLEIRTTQRGSPCLQQSHPGNRPTERCYVMNHISRANSLKNKASVGNTLWKVTKRWECEGDVGQENQQLHDQQEWLRVCPWSQSKVVRFWVMLVHQTSPFLPQSNPWSQVNIARIFCLESRDMGKGCCKRNPCLDNLSMKFFQTKPILV